MVLGAEVLDDDYMPREAEAAGFARVTDSAEATVTWDFRSGDFCVPYEMRFRLVEAPPDAMLEVEWTVEAAVREDDRAEVTVNIEPVGP